MLRPAQLFGSRDQLTGSKHRLTDSQTDLIGSRSSVNGGGGSGHRAEVSREERLRDSNGGDGIYSNFNTLGKKQVQKT